ncbi:hypothetical protein [Nostoc sp. ChiSLP03a]|nr:hypothetical protein [Nostoc sp. ChiSLP03a]MDZ8209855.1 hypothetical protein [Nostoc sp. ChiSLP03a]
MLEIETVRLQLRHLSLDDIDYLFRLYNDAEVMRCLLTEQTQSF